MTLSWEQFGRALLQTEDLDPVYIALSGARLTERVLAQTCLAYWCYYHLGVATQIGEAATNRRFWGAMERAAVNIDRQWPRGAERRHFRGQQSILAVKALQENYDSAEQVLETWFQKQTFADVTDTVQQQRGFGPWAAFKVADMGERVLGREVDFSNCELGVYKEPRQGAALIYHGNWQSPITHEELTVTFEHIVTTFSGYDAPPHRDRKVNIQEAETVCCKYKSYYKNHYWVGKDIHEVRHALHNRGDLAEELLKHCPVEVQMR